MWNKENEICLKVKVNSEGILSNIAKIKADMEVLERDIEKLKSAVSAEESPETESTDKNKIEAFINHILAECEKEELAIEDVRTLPNKLKSSIDRKVKVQNSFTHFHPVNHLGNTR